MPPSRQRKGHGFLTCGKTEAAALKWSFHLQDSRLFHFFIQQDVYKRQVKGRNVGAYETLNEVLVSLFRDVNDIEQKAIITSEFSDITNNDMHVIDAIGIDRPKNMSSIARELSVTVGTLTISVNSLVKKGYVVRNRSSEDRRVVFISLSEKGVKAY